MRSPRSVAVALLIVAIVAGTVAVGRRIVRR